MLGTPVKIEVYTKEGKYLKTILRCLRGFGEIGYTVLYNSHRYQVKYSAEWIADHHGVAKRWIEVDNVN